MSFQLPRIYGAIGKASELRPLADICRWRSLAPPLSYLHFQGLKREKPGLRQIRLPCRRAEANKIRTLRTVRTVIWPPVN